MADAQGTLVLAPAASDSVKVRPADAAAFDLHINVVIFKGFRRESFFGEFVPRAGPCGAETGELFWITHFDGLLRLL